MRNALLALAALLLSGCASTTEKESRECSALGDRPGSPVYEDCMRYAQGIRSVQSQQRAGDSLDWFSRSMTVLGEQQEASNKEAIRMLENSRPVNCVSRRYGNQVNTTCN